MKTCNAMQEWSKICLCCCLDKNHNGPHYDALFDIYFDGINYWYADMAL